MSHANMAAATQLRLEDPLSIPPITNPVFHKQDGPKDMKWFIA